MSENSIEALNILVLLTNQSRALPVIIVVHFTFDYQRLTIKIESLQIQILPGQRSESRGIEQNFLSYIGFCIVRLGELWCLLTSDTSISMLWKNSVNICRFLKQLYFREIECLGTLRLFDCF